MTMTRGLNVESAASCLRTPVPIALRRVGRLTGAGLALVALCVGASSCAARGATPTAGGPVPAPAPTGVTPDRDISDAAERLHRDALVVDTHVDTTQRMLFEQSFDLAARHADGDVDLPRMREGGLDAAFFSIWVPSSVTGPAAIRRALGLIDAVREAVRRHPGDLTLATTAAGIRGAAADGKIAILMGMEGGHMIDDDLGVLRSYAVLGVRYLTLTHSQNTNWADSATADPSHDGLTSFGRNVVLELNRLGVMVDVSHVSDRTFDDALAASRAPVIASHSSSRAIADQPRNMTDDMLRALARNGGVVMINYHVPFLSEAYRQAAAAQTADVRAEIRALNQACGEDEACSLLATARVNRALMTSGRMPRVGWEAIVDHIDHAVQVAGIDHVGLGSDFDGATMPIGMDDVSDLPRITDALLKKGYSDADVAKILGGNILRVMERVEAVGRSLE